MPNQSAGGVDVWLLQLPNQRVVPRIRWWRYGQSSLFVFCRWRLFVEHGASNQHGDVAVAATRRKEEFAIYAC